MAAPDHKIRQCIQRSALFPGRADGGTEDVEAREARSMGAEVGHREGRRSSFPLGDLGLSLGKKNKKINF